MVEPGSEAYCTLLLSDEYLPGAMVLAHSLRDQGTKKQLAILITLDSISASTIDELKTTFDHIIPVDRIINRSPGNLYLMGRPDLSSTFTKIALWRQTQFSHIVYIDADAVALRAPDELFRLPHNLAAVPDIGWPDCFNSGILSLKPNMGDYYALLALAQRGISFDGADQGLLNVHFPNWERLSFAYNCTPSGNYQYAPAYRHFQSTISLVHYIGIGKPWKEGRDRMSGANGVYEELLGRWWAVYDKHYRTQPTAYGSSQQLNKTVQQYVSGELAEDYGIASKLGGRSFENATSGQKSKEALEEQRRRFSTEWDPSRQPPPTNSRPEAPDLPQEIYQMSRNPNLFQAPSVPETPQGLYEFPRSPAAADRPPPIFPWETRAPKATRVFAEDLPSPSAPPSLSAPSETTGSTTESDAQGSETPTITDTTSEPLADFKLANAWDDIPEINRYISTLPQNRRAKVQVLFNQVTSDQPNPTSAHPNPDSITSPTSEYPPDRRPSKVTDFPTEIERPSLPVTPAPVRRPSFWNSERNEAGDLPAAEGVPEQSNWDPVAKLLALRERQSDVLQSGEVGDEAAEIPKRKMPESSSAVRPDGDRVSEPSGQNAKALSGGDGSAAGEKEDVAAEKSEGSTPVPVTTATGEAVAEGTSTPDA
ncbi:uncharacterized protein KY384_000945 [Bacidia gigantensis]|uniref:uncharacterized protein n=1 Tax=Bacidia gigantensis TaxID=2732470 RepID=UPI001D045BA3|nr:uncharacterized protein KY384_000945 [Bacidia gigantensis]KAG8534101.1 hypothetical protein KY384_000945 [Bacidia gigantensis]